MRFSVFKTEGVVVIGTARHRLLASGKTSNGDWYEFEDEPFEQVMSGMDTPPPTVITEPEDG